MGNGVIKPRINYSHVLAELSVNSKYPCEVIREPHGRHLSEKTER